jgi:hypothetical protein
VSTISSCQCTRRTASANPDHLLVSMRAHRVLGSTPRTHARTHADSIGRSGGCSDCGLSASLDRWRAAVDLVDPPPAVDPPPSPLSHRSPWRRRHGPDPGWMMPTSARGVESCCLRIVLAQRQEAASFSPSPPRSSLPRPLQPMACARLVSRIECCEDAHAEAAVVVRSCRTRHRNAAPCREVRLKERP